MEGNQTDTHEIFNSKSFFIKIIIFPENVSWV